MVNKDGTEDLRKYNPGRKGFKGTQLDHGTEIKEGEEECDESED